MAKVAEILKGTKIQDAKGHSDTIRLWESYRDQAMLWRSLALLQIPATFISCVLALYLWSTHKIELKVPSKPLPGIYAAQEIPDTEFMDVATEFVNLIASYQPDVARRQYDKAQQMVVEPLLTKFSTEMSNGEVKAIESTRRTQVFFVDPIKTVLTREDANSVRVKFSGDRLKIVAGKELPMRSSEYAITMKTIPKNKLNPYGIVVTNVEFKDLN